MSAIERFHTDQRMSQGVACNGLVFLAGQVARGAPGASVAEQTRDILARIDALLAQVGSDRTKILQATIWLADIATYDEMNAVWDAWVPPGHAPARACIEARLARPQYAVEIAVIAAR